MAGLQGGLNELIGEPVIVDEKLLRDCRNRNSFGEISFNLYKEAVAIVWVVANARSQDDCEPLELGWNQAICVGFLSRISKLMMSVLKLSSRGEHGGSVQILTRCILESTVDLQFILEKADDEIYRRFIATGLRSERALYDLINRNVMDRAGRMLEIEKSMLDSIRRTCEISGLSIEEIDAKAGNWGGTYRDKLKAIGQEDAYTVFQLIPSQSVHGSWSDLIANYLEIDAGGFSPIPDHPKTDGKFFGPTALFAIDATKAYIGRYFRNSDADFLLRRLDDLRDRVFSVEEARPGMEFEKREI